MINETKDQFFYLNLITPEIGLILIYIVIQSPQGNRHLVRIVFIVMLCMFACTMALYLTRTAASAVRFYDSKGEGTEAYRNLSAKEYEGLIWLRDNTDKDALCACDRFNSVSMKDYDYTKRNNNTHFAYAIYSQRKMYLEGSGFSLFVDQNELRREMLEKNIQMFDKDNDDRGEFARSLGVDYVIVSKENLRQFLDQFLLPFPNLYFQYKLFALNL